jgi:hypothetical protein
VWLASWEEEQNKQQNVRDENQGSSRKANRREKERPELRIRVNESRNIEQRKN